MGVALLLIRISANNWRIHGSIFGGNEIVRLMLSRDVIVLGLTDGVMCASTVFCLFLQKLIARGFLSWNRSGWILQNVCPQAYDLLIHCIADSFTSCGNFFSFLLILHSLCTETGRGHIRSLSRFILLLCS
jgi:hypothetical protein